jgi:hypothetical protein
MPYKDPEKKRAQNAAYYAANRAKARPAILINPDA